MGGNLENLKLVKTMKRRGVKARRDCKSIIRGLVKRNHEKHTMLADVEEEQEQDVICFDDITGKELPWHAVRKARELETGACVTPECMRKPMRRKLLRNMESLQYTRIGLTQTTAFEGESMQIRPQVCARVQKR